MLKQVRGSPKRGPNLLFAGNQEEEKQEEKKQSEGVHSQRPWNFPTIPLGKQ